MSGGVDPLAVMSVLLGLENLQENRDQSAQQEKILQEINEKFDRLERLIQEAVKKMRKIAEAVNYIKDELAGAEKYADEALKYKGTDKEASSMFIGLATTELSHVDSLHTYIVKLINEAKSTGREVPQGMQDVWDWEHTQMLKRYTEIKALLETARK